MSKASKVGSIYYYSICIRVVQIETRIQAQENVDNYDNFTTEYNIVCDKSRSTFIVLSASRQNRTEDFTFFESSVTTR